MVSPNEKVVVGFPEYIPTSELGINDMRRIARLSGGNFVPGDEPRIEYPLSASNLQFGQNGAVCEIPSGFVAIPDSVIRFGETYVEVIQPLIVTQRGEIVQKITLKDGEVYPLAGPEEDPIIKGIARIAKDAVIARMAHPRKA